MTTTPAPADLQRWSDELARNPASLAFLPLARAYRRQGKLDLAVSLCHRGLEQNPGHLEAHALLAVLYLEDGDRARAVDEWSTILRLEPGNFDALRGMGFRYLEQGNIEKAKEHLERAALIRPTDPAVQEALQLLRTRMAEAGEGSVFGSDSASSAAADHDAPDHDAPVLELGEDDAIDILELGDAEVPGAANANGAVSSAPLPSSPRWGAEEVTATSANHAIIEQGVSAADPTRLFDSMLEGPMLGVLLVDGQGRVLAGRLVGAGASQNEAVGALIGGTAHEAARVVEHLGLHAWKGLMLECGNAVVQLSAAGVDAMLVVVARRDTPRGWLARAANQAIALSRPLLRPLLWSDT